MQSLVLDDVRHSDEAQAQGEKYTALLPRGVVGDSVDPDPPQSWELPSLQRCPDAEDMAPAFKSICLSGQSSVLLHC